MQSDRLEAGIGRPQFNLVASAEDSLKSGAGLIDQRDNDFSITRFIATFDQRNVTIANVLIDHRVAFNSQRINSLRTYASQKKPRYADRFRIFNRVDRYAGGDAANQANFTHSIGRHVFHAQTKFKHSRFVFALDQAALLE